jgi:hypothetical protein
MKPLEIIKTKSWVRRDIDAIGHETEMVIPGHTDTDATLQAIIDRVNELSGLNRCCDNGYFGNDHECQKQDSATKRFSAEGLKV